MDISREILQFLHYHPLSSRDEIAKGTAFESSDATLKRLIATGVQKGDIVVEGKARATRYRLSDQAHLLMPLNLETYFAQDVDERQVQTSFNFELIREQLPAVRLFTDEENAHLQELQTEFRQHVSEMTENEYRKEMERLGIDLSWKSSQIEGNTYSLLETERLLRESKTADGKTKEEAVMLLNHKDALRFILDNPDYLQTLTVSHIEDIHQLLTKELSVDRGIRHRRVGITGTNYHPLDNEFQIREAMRDTCDLINSKESIFEKALLTLVLLSYIQAFSDGNKRTARITSNAILIANGYCPLSFRSVDSIDYKKAMLIFYEQNNLYVVIASLVQLVEIVLKKVSPALYQALGIFLPLITTNCAVLGVAILVIQKDYNLLQSVVYAFSTAIGFGIALTVFAGMREQLELVKIPKGMQGMAIVMLSAGLLSLAFMGFSGVDGGLKTLFGLE